MKGGLSRTDAGTQAYLAFAVDDGRVHAAIALELLSAGCLEGKITAMNPDAEISQFPHA
jgi:hypothetical protein